MSLMNKYSMTICRTYLPILIYLQKLYKQAQYMTWYTKDRSKKMK